MDEVRKLRADLYSDEARARRQERRAVREKRIYAQVQDALAQVNSEFANRNAYLWGLGDDDRGASRKISGHAGAAATMYVSETIGEFDIRGSVKSRFSGMDREAGFGGHGITEGTVLVDVEVTPTRGMTQRLEVPVYVKNGYMLQPGLFYHQGVPYVIAQSSLDEIMRSATLGDEVKVDRKSLFSPPKTAALQDGVDMGSARATPTGSMVRLACEVQVPTNEAGDEGYVLSAGSRAFIVAELEEGLHIKHESGIEAVLEHSCIA